MATFTLLSSILYSRLRSVRSRLAFRLRNLPPKGLSHFDEPFAGHLGHVQYFSTSISHAATKLLLHMYLFTSFGVFLLDKFPEEPLMGQRLRTVLGLPKLRATAILGRAGSALMLWRPRHIPRLWAPARLGYPGGPSPPPLQPLRDPGDKCTGIPASFPSKNTCVTLGPLTRTLRMEVRDPLCVDEHSSGRPVADIPHS